MAARSICGKVTIPVKGGMAYTLKSRDRQIPNGLKFLQPETNWQPARFASFNVIVNSLINHRKSNPHLIAQKK
jgi:hypothetical protein